jgi:hypothetical protein
VPTSRRTHLAALNVLAVARQHLGSLDKVTRNELGYLPFAQSGGLV